MGGGSKRLLSSFSGGFVRRAVMGLSLAFLAGCGGWVHMDDRPTGEVPEDVTRSRPVTAMLIEYGGLMELLERQADELLSSCMKRRGFNYLPPDRGDWKGWRQPSDYLNPLSLERAETRGYVPDVEEPPIVEPPVSESEAELEAFGVALMGTSKERVRLDNGMEIGTGGCLGEARATVAGTTEKSVEWLAFSGHIQMLRNEASDQAVASPEWRSAEQSWTQCMKASGYDVDTPADAQDLALAGPDRLPFARPEPDQVPLSDEDRPTEWELQVATADAACRLEMGLEDEWDRLVSFYEQGVIADHPEVVLAWSETAAQMRTVVAEELVAAPNSENDPQGAYPIPSNPP